MALKWETAQIRLSYVRVLNLYLKVDLFVVVKKGIEHLSLANSK